MYSLTTSMQSSQILGGHGIEKWKAWINASAAPDFTSSASAGALTSESCCASEDIAIEVWRCLLEHSVISNPELAATAISSNNPFLSTLLPLLPVVSGKQEKVAWTKQFLAHLKPETNLLKTVGKEGIFILSQRGIDLNRPKVSLVRNMLSLAYEDPAYTTFWKELAEAGYKPKTAHQDVKGFATFFSFLSEKQRRTALLKHENLASLLKNVRKDKGYAVENEQMLTLHLCLNNYEVFDFISADDTTDKERAFALTQASK